MEEREQDFITEKLVRLDLYSLIKDIIKNLVFIVLFGVMCGMAGNIYANYLSSKGNTYTTNAVLIVTTKGGSNYAYSNNSSAYTTANTLTSIINSPIMRNYVQKDLNYSDMSDVTAKASIKGDTNLVDLAVTASTAERSYKITRSIMENYQDLTYTSLGNVILEVFKQPTVPVGSNEYINIKAYENSFFRYGIVLALLIVAFLSIMNDTIKSTDDLADKLDAKALGTVYHEKKYKTFAESRSKKKKSILITDTTTSFSFVESYKKISAKLAYMKKDTDKGIVIMVTSVLENEGKSTVATNTALSLAEGRNRVLLIDCDFRKPAQSLVLSDQKVADIGLSNYLTGNCSLSDILKYDEKRQIYTIFTRKAHSVATELTSCNEMQKLLELVRNEFDYIVLDTPPLVAGVDAEVLAELADASVLVVRYDTLQARDINDAIDLLDSCHAEMAGCILNRAHTIRGFVGGEKGYGYGGYGHYGHYGHYGNNRKEK